MKAGHLPWTGTQMRGKNLIKHFEGVWGGIFDDTIRGNPLPCTLG